MTRDQVLLLCLLFLSRPFAAQTTSTSVSAQSSAASDNCLPAPVLTPTASSQVPVSSQSSGPIIVSTAEINDLMRLVRSATQAGLAPDYPVQKEIAFDGQTLAATVITLYPGSRLLITANGTFGDRGEKYIIARSIKVVPGSPAPEIVWSGSSSSSPMSSVATSFSLGKAPPGSLGAVEGAEGRRGIDGQTGNPGMPGRNAPVLFIFANEVIGGPITIRLNGENGGQGSAGQTGGDGGIGRAGRPGISGVFDCRSGGDNGGAGGQGGDGGQGGPGGRGGNGGTFLFASPMPMSSRADKTFVVNVVGGKGGVSGDGGQCGRGGEGGPGGSGSGLCQGGHPGAKGSSGHLGPKGVSGIDGAPGQFALAILTPEQLDNLGLK
jgi:hypothetical protein